MGWCVSKKLTEPILKTDAEIGREKEMDDRYNKFKKELGNREPSLDFVKNFLVENNLLPEYANMFMKRHREEAYKDFRNYFLIKTNKFTLTGINVEKYFIDDAQGYKKSKDRWIKKFEELQKEGPKFEKALMDYFKNYKSPNLQDFQRILGSNGYEKEEIAEWWFERYEKAKRHKKTYVHDHVLSTNIRPWFKKHEIEDTVSSVPRFVENYKEDHHDAFMVPMVMIFGIIFGTYFYKKIMKKRKQQFRHTKTKRTKMLKDQN